MPIATIAPRKAPSLYASRDLEECTTLQKEEIEVLKSIYPDYVSTRKSDGAVTMEIPVEFESRRDVEVRSKFGRPLENGSISESTSEAEEKISLMVLPPILIRIGLPSSYPLYGPPKILSIRAVSDWLSNVAALQDFLQQMWELGESVLYRWVEYVGSGEFLHDMELVSAEGRVSIQPLHSTPSALASVLSAYDQDFQSARFSENSYPCSICLTQLKGLKCLQLACKHVFCRSCLEDFWRMCIAEGDIERVGCPDPECVEKGNKASEEDLGRVVTESELQRWKWLVRKQTLERDPTMLNCPISTCQNFVPKPDGIDPDSGWDRFRQCSKCTFSFCSFCKHTWHGPISPCPVAHTQRLLLEYLATEEGSPERALIEARYGRSTVTRLVKQHEEENATQAWISSSTTTCPGCESSVEKSEGCNHMTCTRCGHHFCYRCGTKLAPKDPYSHFSLSGTSCYRKLFDWVSEQGEGPR